MENAEAWVIDHQNTAYRLSEYVLSQNKGYLWLCVPRQELLDNLAKIETIIGAHLNEQHIKDALNNEHPSFFDNTENYELIIFRGVASSQFDMDIPSVTLTAASIVCFNFDKVLLTIYDKQDTVITRIQDNLRRNTRHNGITTNPSDLVYKILHTVIEQTLSLRNPLIMQISEWQKLLLENSSHFNAWTEFMAFKSSVEQITLWCEDQEDVIEDWQQYARLEKQEQLNINLNDLSDHIERCIRYSQKLTSSLDMLIQLHFSALSHRNNEVLRILAIISCIFLPLTLITGIFGMNFNNMPILHETHAYYYTIGIMVSLAFVMLGIFRWRKWL